MKKWTACGADVVRGLASLFGPDYSRFTEFFQKGQSAFRRSPPSDPIASSEKRRLMKFQPKRFVVEVKRGTSRAAFTSPDTVADRFNTAEAALFGRAAAPLPALKQPEVEKTEPPGGRILRSLVEPPPPEMPELPEPARRGRKPGSKNKPKPQALAPDGAEIASERPRRGRKPGSKNKPKAPSSAVVSEHEAFRSIEDDVSSPQADGFADGGAAWGGPAPLAVTAVAAADFAQAPARPASRLRDRSSILRRYVLGLEPGPGERSFGRAHRRGRADRGGARADS